MPLISVIIPLYNHEKYIKEAVNSVLNQTVNDFELIIINDGSEDKSEEVVNGIRDSRIRYFAQLNQGAHNTINRGISIAQGEYVAILNSDDCYDSKRFEKCLDIFINNSSTDAVFSEIDYIDENGNSEKITLRAEENGEGIENSCSFKDSKILTLDLLAGNFLKTTSNLFCRKTCFETVGIFRNLRYAHDYDFFLRLSINCNVALIKDPLLKYRSHEDNTLKECKAATDLECSLVILDFLMKYDLGTFLTNIDPTLLIKLFNSVNTYRAEKILFILMIFSKLTKNRESALENFIRKPNDDFWVIARKYIENYHDGWQAREEISIEWDRLHQLYLKCDEELANIKMSKGYRVERYFRGLLGAI